MSSKTPKHPLEHVPAPAADAVTELPSPAVRDALYEQFARIGQAISNPTRLHLLSLLDQGEKSVDTLSKQSGHRFVTVSSHLKVLREAHLVTTRRDGRQMFYSIASDDVMRLCSTLRTVGLSALPEVRELVQRYYDAPETMAAVDARELLAQAQRYEIVLVDLRPPEEYAAGHLPEAHSIPFADLEKHLDDLPKDKPILAYCRGRYCVMGVKGVDLLRRRGFNAQRLPWGVADWQLQGFSLSHDPPLSH